MSEASGDEEDYEVEEILDVTLNDNDKFKPYFLVSWVRGYE